MVFILILSFIILLIFILYNIYIYNKLRKMEKHTKILNRDLENMLTYTYKVEFVRMLDCSVSYCCFTSLKNVLEFCLAYDSSFEIKKIVNIKNGEIISQQTKQSRNTKILEELESMAESL